MARKRRHSIRNRVLLIAGFGGLAALAVGIAFFTTQAFTGPTSSGGVGNGAIASDSSNNVAVGTSTTNATTKFFSMGAGNTSATNAFKAVSANGTALITAQDDGVINIPGTISGPTFTGTVNAANVSSGAFGQNTTGGDYSFPSRVGIGTTVNASRGLFIKSPDSTNIPIEGIASDNINSIYFRPNVGGLAVNLISSDYINGGSAYLPLALSGRENYNDLVLSTAGNVGIGTAPGAKLHVLGTETRLQSDNAYLSFFTTAGTRQGYLQSSGGGMYLVNEVSNGPLVFYTSNLQRALIDGAGNVGIGTGSPRGKLEVSTAGSIGSLIVGNPNDLSTGTVIIGTTNQGQALSLTDSVNAHTYFEFSSSAPAGSRIRTDSNLVIQSPSGGSLTLLNGGNVGIGNTNPAFKLSVNGFSSLQGGVKIGPSAATETSWQYYPNVASYTCHSSCSGAIIIHTGIARAGNEMFKIHVNGYGYGGGAVIDFDVVGYPYSGVNGNIDGQGGAVINYSIVDKGNDGLSKYIGVDASGKIAIAVGDYNSTFYYYGVNVDYYDTWASVDHSTGWSIDRSTTNNFSWKDIHTISSTHPYIGGGLTFPDGTTQTTAFLGGNQVVNAANVSAGTFGQNTSGGNFTFPGGGRVAINGSGITSGNAYGIGNGAAYSNLNSIAVDTVETDGGTGGSGILELNYYGGSGVRVGTGGGNKWIAASQFIDGDNTGYYVDPASTSQLNNVYAAGDFYANGALGYGLVGQYDPTKYRNVYAMGPAYRLAADGSTSNNFYGIAMTYEPNYGGSGNNAQAKSGLGHQFLFMQGGVTGTAIGTGIWTSGNITTSAGSLYVGNLSLRNDSNRYFQNYSGDNTAGGFQLRRSDGANWGYLYADSGGIGLLSGAGGWGVRLNGAANGNNTDILFYTNNVQRLQIDASGNLVFSNSNPYITASSYFIAPGGAYFNSGTVYTEAQIQARGGIGTDTSAYLTVQGGTANLGGVYMPGTLAVGANTPSGYRFEVQGGSSGTWTSRISDGFNGATVYMANGAGYGMYVYPGSDASSGTYALQVLNSSGANALYVRGDGNVGINTASPSTKLVVVNNSDYRFGSGTRFQSADSGNYYEVFINSDGSNGATSIQGWQENVGAAPLFLQPSGGSVNIGNSNNGYQLQVSTDSAAKPNGGSWTNSSDVRLKKDITPVSGALDKITSLNPVLFDWRNPSLHGGTAASGGFIAQDVQKVFPSFVTEEQCNSADCNLVGGPGSKEYALTLPFTFDAYMVGAVKELNAKVDTQQAEIDELKAEIQQLKGSGTVPSQNVSATDAVSAAPAPSQESFLSRFFSGVFSLLAAPLHAFAFSQQ
jgi:hypothetical protein